MKKILNLRSNIWSISNIKKQEYQIIITFLERLRSNWSEEVFVISGLNGEEIFGSFCRKESQKTNQT